MENNNDVQNKEDLEKIQKEINEAIDIYKIEDLLKNNEYVFELKGVTYKIRKPTFKEKEEAFQKKLEKYVELLKDDKYVLEEDLKKLYLKRGVDINDIQRKVDNKLRERDQFMLKLGKAIKDKAPDNELQTYKTQIEDMSREINTLTIEKTNLLGPSIENQCMIYFFVYLTYLITEKKDGEKWIKVWKDFTEYQSSDVELVNKASFYASIIGGMDVTSS